MYCIYYFNVKECLNIKIQTSFLSILEATGLTRSILDTIEMNRLQGQGDDGTFCKKLGAVY